jgi:hypothetical protein
VAAPAISGRLIAPARPIATKAAPVAAVRLKIILDIAFCLPAHAEVPKKRSRLAGRAGSCPVQAGVPEPIANGGARPNTLEVPLLTDGPSRGEPRRSPPGWMRSLSRPPRVGRELPPWTSTLETRLEAPSAMFPIALQFMRRGWQIFANGSRNNVFIAQYTAPFTLSA